MIITIASVALGGLVLIYTAVALLGDTREGPQ